MKSVTKLKDDARKHEQKEEWEKAIQAYLQVLKTGEEGEGELDLPLYNRVGDLYLRLSKPNDAVRYYVQAADRYAEAGLYNNAIALCNKAMRYAPGQLDLLRKLGQFSAWQGFLTDARRYFLEFAEKKFAGGAVDEALTALEEFAEASGDAEVREMLARQLHAHGRTDEAVSELKKAHAVRVSSGDHAGADAVRTEIEALAPGTVVASAAPAAPAPAFESPAPTAAPAEPAKPTAEDYGFEISLPGDEPAEETTLAGFESTAFDAAEPEDTGGFQLQGFETTHAEPEVEDDETTFQLPDFESTAHEDAITSEDLGLEPTVFEAPADIDAEALPGLELDESSFSDSATEETGDFALDLPMLDGSDADTSFDGETDSAAFDLPSFEIEQPEEATSDEFGHFELPMLGGDAAESEHDDDDTHSGFDLPLLGSEEGAAEGAEAGEAEGVEEAAADHARDFESRGDDFGEYGSGGVAEISFDSPAETTSHTDTFEDEAETDTDAESVPDAIDEEILAWRPEAEAEVEAEAAPQDAADAPASADATEAPEPPAAEGDTADGNWDPSALGFDTSAPSTPAPAAPPSKAKAKDGSDYIDLGAFFAEDDEEDAGTRFRVQEKPPTGDEDRDFAELLSQFKQKVSENVSAEDSAAHYDLGLAFKEMGLVDEAISEFQIAMRAGDMRLRVYEELGQCFLLKDQYNIAEKVLKRALEMKQGDEADMIGVYYHLGRAYEGLGNRDAARDAYERVLGLDINFQDVTLRLKRL